MALTGWPGIARSWRIGGMNPPDVCLMTITLTPPPARSLRRQFKLTSDPEDIHALLQSVGLRTTRPRIKMLQTILGLPKPSTIDQIYEAMDRSCDFVTVYRMIAALEAEGIVQRCGYLAKHGGAALFCVGGRQFPVLFRGGDGMLDLDEESAAELENCLARIIPRLEARGMRDVRPYVQFEGKINAA